MLLLFNVPSLATFLLSLFPPRSHISFLLVVATTLFKWCYIQDSDTVHYVASISHLIINTVVVLWGVRRRYGLGSEMATTLLLTGYKLRSYSNSPLLWRNSEHVSYVRVIIRCEYARTLTQAHIEPGGPWTHQSFQLSEEFGRLLESWPD